MFHKFQMTASVTLLLIGLFVLPYAGNVAKVSAENYNCSGSKKEVRQCLKAVISERDATIAELVAKREEQIEYIKLQEQNVIRLEELRANDKEMAQHDLNQVIRSKDETLRNQLSDCHAMRGDIETNPKHGKH